MNLPNKGRHIERALVCCVVATLTTGALPALAQDQNQEIPETVVVTGSRIHQSPLNEASPVISVSDEDIAKTGQTSIGDILQHMPVSGGSVNTRYNFSGNQGFPPDGGGLGAGATTADLRHMGPKRVLVLVDGIRWVNEASASGVSAATDLNTIPTSIIDRVEVLQDGASSIYGADAIAGVVNIITKKNFNGVEFSGYGGQYGEGDGDIQQWSISLGSTGEQLSSFVSLNYMSQGRVNSIDRDISQYPRPYATSCAAGGCSSGTPQGRMDFTDPNTGQALSITVNDGVTGIPFYNPADPAAGPRTDDFHNFGVNDRFNFQPYNLMQTPSERVGLYGQSEYHLTDHASFYMKGLFNERRSKNQAAPEPLFVGPEAGNGNLMDTIQIDALNPYNPFGFTLNAATTGPGATDYFIGRRPLEGGPRIFQQSVDTWYLGSGFRGDFQFADRDFYWDVNAIWSRNSADQTTHGSYNSAKLKSALGPGVAAGINGATTTACGAVVVVAGVPTVPNPIPGCVPFNITGGQGDGSGTITQAMLDYIRPVLHDTSEQELKDFTANLTGTIVSMPAGGLDFAIGFEHRSQSGFYQPDAIYTAGESAGVPSTPTSGKYDVDEFYGELQIPLLKDLPGADLLQVSAAVRSSDYSTFGSQTASKFGLNWRPLKDLLIRGSYSKGIRAPSIGELFGSAARFDQTLVDPCSDYTGAINGGPAAPANIQANCLALGVPATYAQINSQISVTTGGNSALVPEETTNSYTAGFVYSPRWAESASWSNGLSFEFTYYNIDLESAISALDAQVQINRCAATLDPALCGGISRTSGGTINGFANQLLNIGAIKTKGWDFNINWSMPEVSWGRFGVAWQTTHLNEYNEFTPSSTGFQVTERAGTEKGDLGAAYPDWKSTMTIDWRHADWGASTSVRYMSSVTDINGLSLSATTYVDAQVMWTPSQFMDGTWDISVGANNLFDQDPPPCQTCALNGYDPSTYDAPGVFLYARAVAHFGKQ